MPNANEIRDKISQRIFDAVTRGTPPWKKMWSSIPDPFRLPSNISSGNPKAYRGINILLLQLEAIEKNYPVGAWATYKGFQALGQQVRRGERSTQVVYYKQLKKTKINDDGKEETTTFPLLRTWNVFNISQTDGPLADKYLAPSTSQPVDDGDHSEFFKVIEATKLSIKVGGNRAAYYRSPLDFIQMPRREQFDDFPAWAETLGHEIIHASGADHRLARKLSYAKEELVAEIGAAFLLQATGVPHPHIENSASYVAGWLKAIEGEDARFIFKAASLASDAVDYILGFGTSAESTEEELATEAA